MEDLEKWMNTVPEPTLRRLPWYLSISKLLHAQGEDYVSSTRLAKEVNMDASQVAKDLSYVRITGRTRVGYAIQSLVTVLEDYLGFTHLHKAFLFGVGNLGSALLADKGLRQFGLEIVGAFDINPQLIGTMVAGIPVYPWERLEACCKETGVDIGVLTVPFAIAQEVADRLVAAGLHAVWNFTPIRIRVPEGIVVQNTSLYAHLAVMFNRMNENQAHRDLKQLEK